MIIKIDKALCNGCGICANACQEGAIGIKDGKAVLLREDYCDGLGNCLPTCPTNAISFEEREAAPFDEAAVNQNIKRNKEQSEKIESRLQQWPIQIKLVPENAPYFSGELLVAADCTAYAYGDFHRDFMEEKAVVVGCTKLDNIDYSEKLSNIFRNNDIKNITVTRMEVPCCGGMEYAVKKAIQESGKEIPLNVVTISRDGKIK